MELDFYRCFWTLQGYLSFAIKVHEIIEKWKGFGKDVSSFIFFPLISCWSELLAIVSKGINTSSRLLVSNNQIWNNIHILFITSNKPRQILDSKVQCLHLESNQLLTKKYCSHFHLSRRITNISMFPHVDTCMSANEVQSLLSGKLWTMIKMWSEVLQRKRRKPGSIAPTCPSLNLSP